MEILDRLDAAIGRVLHMPPAYEKRKAREKKTMKITRTAVCEIVVWSTVVGVILTIFTGFCRTPFLNLIGVSYWGVPFAWLKQIVYPGATKEIIWHGMLMDIVTWALPSGVVITLGLLHEKRKAGARKPKE